MENENGTVTHHTNNNYVLIFHNIDNALNSEVKQRMIDTFFAVYPQLVSRFNPNSPHTVKFTVDPTFNECPAVAYADAIMFSATWLREHPEDTDTVTHEVMHVVQAYPAGNPGWLVEGIADYARAKYGTNNMAAGWSMPAYSSTQSYTDSYRITARFLTWLETRIKASIVDELDSCLRQRTYDEQTWKYLAGQPVTQLWNEYSQNPQLNTISAITRIECGGVYKVVNSISGKALDVLQSGKENGTNVQIYRDNDSAAQKWIVEDSGNGSYKLINAIGRKVLDVQQSGTTDGTNVHIWDDNGSNAQRWRLQAIDNGHLHKIINVLSNKALDVNHSGVADGTNVQIWSDNDTSAQKWQFIRLL
jgi:hypothetical protein